MNRSIWLGRSIIRFIIVAATVAICPAVPAWAEPPEGRKGSPDRPPLDPLRAALDVNHDRALDADEIKNAATALATLDRNGDGRIDQEEFRPPLPPGRRGPPEGRERGGRRGPPRDGEVERRGPRDGEVERRGPRDGEAGPPGPRDGERGGPPGPRDGDFEGRPPRERDGDRRGPPEERDRPE